jgi:hypothetical protein
LRRGIGARARLSKAAAIRAPQANTRRGTVTRLAEAVLPGELGDAGFTRVSRGFTQWIGGYRAGAELVHPYGSTNIQRTGESPAGRWRTQLGALDRDARAKHRRGFSALTRDQRRELVVAALGAERTSRLPQPLDANHVALALVAWYFAQPEATNLCYQAKIDRNQCRPLVNAPRQPLPLVTRGPGTGDRGP